MRRRLLETAAVVATLLPAAVVATLLPAAAPRAAWAGPSAVVSQPADGAQLATAPAAVRLSLPGRADLGLSHVTVWDSAGKSHDSGALSQIGGVLSQPLRLTAAGNYSCTYHVVLEDGSEAVGRIRFSVGTGEPPPVTVPAAQAAAEATGASGHEHGVDPLSLGLLVADVLVVIVVLGALVRKRGSPPAERPRRLWKLPAE